MHTTNSSAGKPLLQFTYKLDIKHKTAVCISGAAKAKRKEIKKKICCGQTLKSEVVIKKTNRNFIEDLYHCIIHHPQVVKYPIANYCLQVSIAGKSKKR